MNISGKLTLAGVLTGGMALTGCSVGYEGKPFGASQTITRNDQSCTMSVENSINLLFIGGTVTNNSFNDQCARHQIVQLLLSADLSRDPRADADTKAVALAIAGMDNTQVEQAIENVAEGLAPDIRRRVQHNVNNYRENLKAQGAAEAQAALAPRINDMEAELAEANSMHISIEKPDFCGEEHYTHITHELNSAYPTATVSLTESTLENMGLSLDPNMPNLEETKADLCFGSFLYVSATQGYGENMIKVRDERFYQDQSTFAGGNDANRPQLNAQIIVGHIAQKFNASDEYRENIQRAADMERMQQRIIAQQQQAAEEEAARVEQARAEAQRLETLHAERARAAEQQADIQEASLEIEELRPVDRRDQSPTVMTTAPTMPSFGTADAGSAFDRAQDPEQKPQNNNVQDAVFRQDVQPESETPTEYVVKASFSPMIHVSTTAREDRPGLDCETVVATYDKIRTHDYMGITRNFEISAGNIDHLVCPADNDNGLTKVFVAANYAEDAKDPLSRLPADVHVQDRPNGLMARMRSIFN